VAPILILAPLRIEAHALRRGCRSATVVRMGMGPEAAARAGERLPVLAGGHPVAVAGFGGGLRPEISTGDLVVAEEIRGRGVPRIPLPYAAGAAEALKAAGLTVHVGPVVSSERLAFGSREQLGADGSLAVDMESYWLLEKLAARDDDPGGGGAAPPIVVVRAISDTAGKLVLGGLLPAGWLRAYRSLVYAGPALELWAASVLR
jgi:4-hydroxy-3-methylbut-2-en-1-yl diphosphate reductase